VWTWTALCSDTKLVPSWLVGERTADDAEIFMRDLAFRLCHRVQLTTDGHRAYLNAFGADIDDALLHEIYAAPETPEDQRRDGPRRLHRYRPTGGARQSQPRQGVHVLCGAAELVDADGCAPVHPTHQRLLNEDRELGVRGVTALHARHLRSLVPDAQHKTTAGRRPRPRWLPGSPTACGRTTTSLRCSINRQTDPLPECGCWVER
jgi:hypothetical protein